MANRINDQDLYDVARVLNNYTNSPQEYGEVGNYHISFAYGGSCLHREVKGGGVEDVLSCGHVPKKELYKMMSAYMDGMQDERRSNDEKG